MMCSSTAQIILTVFMLSAERAPTLLAVTGAVSIWSKERDGESAVDAEFQRWAVGRGGALLAFVSAVRGEKGWPVALKADQKQYCVEVLRRALGLLAHSSRAFSRCG